MKYIATIHKLADTGDSLRVSFTNVRRKRDAFWRPYGKEVEIDMPHAMGKPFHVGRTVELNITPKD